jgi:hypothetical protein
MTRLPTPAVPLTPKFGNANELSYLIERIRDAPDWSARIEKLDRILFNGSVQAIANGATAETIMSTAIVGITVGLEQQLGECKIESAAAALVYSIATHKRDAAYQLLPADVNALAACRPGLLLISQLVTALDGKKGASPPARFRNAVG